MSEPGFNHDYYLQFNHDTTEKINEFLDYVIKSCDEVNKTFQEKHEGYIISKMLYKIYNGDEVTTKKWKEAAEKLNTMIYRFYYIEAVIDNETGKDLFVKYDIESDQVFKVGCSCQRCIKNRGALTTTE